MASFQINFLFEERLQKHWCLDLNFVLSDSMEYQPLICRDLDMHAITFSYITTSLRH